MALHNFVDKVEWKDTPKKDYVLYFGRFSKEKGIDTLIRVCRKLPDVQFVFAGAGPLGSELNGIANIKNVGFQHGEALEKLIREHVSASIRPSGMRTARFQSWKARCMGRRCWEPTLAASPN